MRPLHAIEVHCALNARLCQSTQNDEVFGSVCLFRLGNNRTGIAPVPIGRPAKAAAAMTMMMQ